MSLWKRLLKKQKNNDEMKFVSAHINAYESFINATHVLWRRFPHIKFIFCYFVLDDQMLLNYNSA